MEIRVKGSDVPKPIVSFAHLNFDETMIHSITKKGFEKPTAIQCQALPCLLSGRDVIGIAKTGSGKTLAYVWPLIAHILDQVFFFFFFNFFLIFFIFCRNHLKKMRDRLA